MVRKISLGWSSWLAFVVPVGLSITCSNIELPPPSEEHTCKPPTFRPVTFDKGIIPILYDRTRHLFESYHAVGNELYPEPIQVHVSAGLIRPEQIAILSGSVYAAEGEQRVPLPCATIRILGHAEYGSTMSRADGKFDFAVNGGQQYVLIVEQPGYLPVHRSISPAAQQYEQLSNVVMHSLAGPGTVVDLSQLTTPTAVYGKQITDQDGTRQLTLLFKPGTDAKLRMPDGGTTAVPRITVITAEYTEGPDGASSMPGTLPENSGYTYAVEVLTKEALTAGATGVEFSQPVVTYVDNFLNFPVGTIVPAGYYDAQAAEWVASQNGRVIKIKGTRPDGMVDLDTNGDDVIDSTQRLEQLGIDAAERLFLAAYPAGRELWRVPVEHFTPWDYSWPFGPPPGAIKPVMESIVGQHDFGQCVDHPSNADLITWGITLECAPNVNPLMPKPAFSVQFPLNGSKDAIKLRYASNRVPGYTAASSTDVAVVLGRVAETHPIKAVELTVRLNNANNILFHKVWNNPRSQLDSIITVPWDGTDGMGTNLTFAPATISLDYVYDGHYYTTKMEQGELFGYFPDNVDVSSHVDTRNAIRLSGQKTVSLELETCQWAGLGGLCVDVNHQYDRISHRLWLGDGRVLDAPDVVEGSALYIQKVDTPVSLESPVSVVVGDFLDRAAQTLVGDEGRNQILNLQDKKFVVGKLHSPTYTNNPVDPVAAELDSVSSMAIGGNGEIYLADRGNRRVRVLKKAKSKMGAPYVFTLAGSLKSFVPTGSGPPLQTCLGKPEGLAIMSLNPQEQVLFISDSGGGNCPDTSSSQAGHRIWSLRLPTQPNIPSSDYPTDNPADWTSLQMNVFAGTGVQGMADVATDATTASFNAPAGLASWTAPDGSRWLFVADRDNNCVRRINILGKGQVGGQVQTVVGTCNPARADYGVGGSGHWAKFALLSHPTALMVNGNFLYISDTGNNRVRRVDLRSSPVSEWTIFTVAGNGGKPAAGCAFDTKTSCLAGEAGIDSPQGLAINSQGEILIASKDQRLLKLFSSIPVPIGTSIEEVVSLTDPLTGQRYQFDRLGRHIATLDSTNTAQARYQFKYDAQGRLQEITDVMLNKVAFSVQSRSPAQIVLTSDLVTAGTTTTLQLKVDSKKTDDYWLNQVNIDGMGTWVFQQDTFVGRGLMDMVKNGSYTHIFTYDPEGRLKTYKDPNSKTYNVVLN